jgi:signal transduction histidine kinase
MSAPNDGPLTAPAAAERPAATVSGRARGRLAALRPYALSLLAGCTLALLAWAAILLVRQPYSGLNWSYTTGVVQTVDPHGPGAALFQPGDRLVAVDGAPVYAARDLPGLRADDWVTLSVVREGVESARRLQLVAPPPPVLFSRLAVILVALSFWLLGTLVLALGPSSNLITLFFLFCQAFAAALGLGSVSASGPLWSGWAFNFILWWIAPLALHTHLLLAEALSSRRRVRLILYLYGFTLILSMLDLWRLLAPAPGLLVAIKLAWVGLLLLLSAAVLVWASRRERPLPSRRKTGIAALSASLSFLPLVLFSLLPDGLLGRLLLPYEVTLLALPLLPLGYAYAIGRRRLVRIERYVNRSVAYALVAVLASVLYAAFYLAQQRLASGDEWTVSPADFAATTLLIVAVPLIYRTLQRMVDRVFYGTWYDDRAAVQQVSHSVAEARGDAGDIGSALCLALLRVFQLESVTLLLYGGQFIAASAGASATRREEWGAPRAAALLTAMRAATGETIGRGAELPAHLPLSPGEKRKLLGERPQLWLLLGERERSQGLLVLGARRGGGDLAPRDLEILEVVVRQAGAALENEYLLSEVRQYSAHFRRLHRQIVQAREEERKRVARNLHDNTIQALVGLNYQLAHARRRAGDEAMAQLAALQEEVRAILGDVRGICLELRPPALDTLGLVPALQSHIAEVKAQAPLQIRLQAAALNGSEIPDVVAPHALPFSARSAAQRAETCRGSDGSRRIGNSCGRAVGADGDRRRARLPAAGEAEHVDAGPPFWIGRIAGTGGSPWRYDAGLLRTGRGLHVAGCRSDP